MEKELISNKLQNKKMINLIFEMSLPAILSMFVLSLYNIVDSLFVARFDTKALDALSIVFPMQQLLIAFAIGIGIGTKAYVSSRLGQKNVEEAENGAKTGVLLAFFTGLGFIIVGLVASRPFVENYTNDPVVIEYGVRYLNIVLCLSVFSIIDVVGSKILQSTGNMKIPMITQIVGAVVNIILDPIFIFVFNMGVKGAAVATIIGQICAMTITISVFRFTKQDVSIFINKNFRFKWETIKGIMVIGIPTLVMNSLNSVTVTILNLILKSYAGAITILGIYFKLQSFVFMPVFGLSQGTLPIYSYNYGAKNKERFESCYKLNIIIALAIMCLGFILFMALPEAFMKMFDCPPSMIKDGVVALRILSLAFVPASIGITSSNMIQGLRMGFLSMVFSLSRQIIILLPSSFLLAHFFGLGGIWYGYAISEVIVVLVFIFTVKPIINKKFRQLEVKNAI